MSNLKKFVISPFQRYARGFPRRSGGGRGGTDRRLALLSGYINQVRAEEENVLYVIAGAWCRLADRQRVQGRLDHGDHELPGADVVALGNHELDYGLPHLLFLEKVANFPIVNANLLITPYNKRLMRPHLIINKAGFDILFTGIITEKVMDSLSRDSLIRSFVSLEEASQAVGRIANAYKDDDIDLTILLTHIGYESDLELARLLDPAWGVDMIIGGHSHTVLSEPACENGILVAQAGTGTNQIGRFDIVVDDDTNSIVEYSWRLIPSTTNCQARPRPARLYLSLQEKVDHKYNTLLCKLAVR